VPGGDDRRVAGDGVDGMDGKKKQDVGVIMLGQFLKRVERITIDEGGWMKFKLREGSQKKRREPQRAQRDAEEEKKQEDKQERERVATEYEKEQRERLRKEEEEFTAEEYDAAMKQLDKEWEAGAKLSKEEERELIENIWGEQIMDKRDLERVKRWKQPAMKAAEDRGFAWGFVVGALIMLGMILFWWTLAGL
jgi:flagellar biosynthesis GTPase FlhF